MMRRRQSDEAGYAAVLVALLVPTIFIGLAAIGVDTARWYVEIQRVQRAADAAALAGVTYMPADFTSASAAALVVATKNGYPASADTVIDVAHGSLPSQLRVTITTTIGNTFGQFIGTPTATIRRSSLADFSAPSPMGSPCNIFGNEPPSQAGAALPTGTALPAVPFPQNNCSSTPQFWAAIEGPSTDKVQGDRYMTIPCTTAGTFNCASSLNDEKPPHPEGYFFTIHVEPVAVNTQIDLQIYDPAFVYTTIGCSSLPSTGSLSNNMNPYTNTDGKLRYTQWKNTSNTVINAGAQQYCSGDYNPGVGSPPANPPTTSFAVREQTDTADPMKGAVVSGCTKQYTGTSTVPTVNSLTNGTAAYNPQRASVFHEWVSLCTFTPTRSGDYYLQVRTNVSAGGTSAANTNSTGANFTPVVYSGNAAASAATGNNNAAVGLNSFAMRAVPSSASYRDDVAVSGFSRMPILQNANTSSVTFNLIRALPASRGQYVAFDFFDAADGSTGAGSVKVLAPGDATGSISTVPNVPGCQGALNNGSYTNLTNCTVTVRASTHNGNLQRVVIPLPADYNCDPATLGGCWFRVQITFAAGSNVTDFTTWDANIGGDPVRLIE